MSAGLPRNWARTFWQFPSARSGKLRKVCLRGGNNLCIVLSRVQRAVKGFLWRCFVKRGKIEFLPRCRPLCAHKLKNIRFCICFMTVSPHLKPRGGSKSRLLHRPFLLLRRKPPFPVPSCLWTRPCAISTGKP